MIKLDYSGFERTGNPCYFRAMHNVANDPESAIVYKLEVLAEQVFFPFVDGDFFAISQVEDDDNGSVEYVIISEGLTGSFLSKGFTFKEAFDQANKRLRKTTPQKWQEAIAALEEVSPRYRRKEVVSE
jgi:hypothetical protein